MGSFGGWVHAVYENKYGAQRTHVIPCDDYREHEPCCWCNPEWLYEDDGIVLVHQALDGREDFEEGRRKPS